MKPKAKRQLSFFDEPAPAPKITSKADPLYNREAPFTIRGAKDMDDRIKALGVLLAQRAPADDAPILGDWIVRLNVAARSGVELELVQEAEAIAEEAEAHAQAAHLEAVEAHARMMAAGKAAKKRPAKPRRKAAPVPCTLVDLGQSDAATLARARRKSDLYVRAVLALGFGVLN